MKKLPNRIQEIRKANNLTLKGLGDLLGTAPIQVKRLEEGERKLTVQWMDRIASALKCTSADLLLSSSPTFPEDISEIYAALSPEKQEIATQVLKGLLADQTAKNK